MITGGKVGEIWDRKRVFAIGCVIYGCGSLLTALSQSLPMLLIGWSLLEGIGAALIMPAVVALVASNFGQADRPRAYGLVVRLRRGLPTANPDRKVESCRLQKRCGSVG
jgi:MFS family permease